MYVRAWAFEAQLERFFREKFGSTWFAQRERRLAAARALVEKASG